jgi:RNase P/RNase MRP subunit POP5
MCEQNLSGEQFEAALIDTVRRLFGEFGLARIHPKVMHFSQTNCEATVACNQEGAENLQAAIGLMTRSSAPTFTAITIHVSGTLKGLRRK